MSVRESLTAFLCDEARDRALAEGGDFPTVYRRLCEDIGIDPDPPRHQFAREDDDELDLLDAVEARLRSVDKALAAKFKAWAMEHARRAEAADDRRASTSCGPWCSKD